MSDIRLIASRHSAFYSPLISMIAGGFLEKEGLSGTYAPAAPGQNSVVEVAEGRADVGQSAVSGSWAALDAGQKPPVAHFAQINARDGFIVAAREPDAEFKWEKLLDAQFLYVHGGQPEAMLRYGLHRSGIDLSNIEGVESPGGDEMMQQWRNRLGDYFHEQGAFPQQLEYEGIGHIVGSIGEIVGPTAFSSLTARWSYLDTDEAKRVTTAYRASREWVNTADPMEVAQAEAPFFPGIAVEATASAVAYYQRLGTWDGDIEIPQRLYETALDVFEHSGMVSARHAYEEVVAPPPGD
jgi:NitT/TauT family transport system substrate-binding protein